MKSTKWKQEELFKESSKPGAVFCFVLFQKINKIDKPLARFTRGHKDSILINKIRNEKEDITTDLKKSKTSSDPTTTAILNKTGKPG